MDRRRFSVAASRVCNSLSVELRTDYDSILTCCYWPTHGWCT